MEAEVEVGTGYDGMILLGIVLVVGRLMIDTCCWVRRYFSCTWDKKLKLHSFKIIGLGLLLGVNKKKRHFYFVVKIGTSTSILSLSLSLSLYVCLI